MTVHLGYVERCSILEYAGRRDLVEAIAGGNLTIPEAEKAAGLAWVKVHADIPTRWVVFCGDAVLSIDHTSEKSAQAWATRYNRRKLGMDAS